MAEVVHESGRTLNVSGTQARALAKRPGWSLPPTAPSAPTSSSLKSEWVDWAVTNGADPDEAEALTKDELVERYGA
jgi:hypothetical protein